MSDPDVDKEATKREIEKLKSENKREEDEITALSARNAFDPKIAGNNQNVKLLRDNVKVAFDRFQSLQRIAFAESRNEKKSEKEREEEQKKSNAYGKSGTELSRDLEKADNTDLKDFPKQ